MSGFGETLRQAREARGYSLSDVAEATKVRLQYLKWLEQDELSRLPGSTFNKGYVRTYAEFVGADPEAWLLAYLEEEREQTRAGRLESAPDVVGEMSRTIGVAPASSPWGKLLGVVALVAVIAVVGTWWWLQRGKTEAPPSSPPPAVVTAPQPEPEPATEVQPAVDADPEPEAEVEAATAAPAPAPPPPSTPSAMTVPDYGVGTGVVDRQLVGESSSFASGTRVVFWTRVLGGSQGDVVHHVWFHEGRRISTAALAIGGGHWRTHSAKTLTLDGAWAVEAQDAAGSVLARVEFESGQ